MPGRAADIAMVAVVVDCPLSEREQPLSGRVPELWDSLGFWSYMWRSVNYTKASSFQIGEISARQIWLRTTVLLYDYKP